MTEKNILENITSIELGSMTLESEKPTPVLTIKTRNGNYVFRLSETFDIQKHVSIFRAFVMDLQSQSIAENVAEEKKVEESPVTMDSVQEEPKKEKHDGARLFDEPPSAPTDVEITVKE